MLILEKYFMLFIIYSLLGWCLEVVWTFIRTKKIVNRGFFLGPYCPIYGAGCLLLISLLDRFKNNTILLLILSAVICSILEYLGSYILEKLFNNRWWDYTHYRFNLNGRICAETMIPFSIIGVIVVCYMNPFFVKNINVSHIVFYTVLTIFVIDSIISFIISKKAKTTANTDLNKEKEITNKAK